MAEIWLKAKDRQAVADAFDEIEHVLKNDAPMHGREHPAGWRVILRTPLAATFKVSEDDRLEKILSVFYRPWAPGFS